MLAMYFNTFNSFNTYYVTTEHFSAAQNVGSWVIYEEDAYNTNTSPSTSSLWSLLSFILGWPANI